jgi:two-component system NarL family sensor kinase
VVEGTEGRAGRRLVVLLWWSVCALSLLLIALTVAFHLVTRYDWYFNGSHQPWRTQIVQALGVLGAPLLGALIVWRQPTNRYGWVWCGLGLAVAVRGAAFAYQVWAWYVAPMQPGGSIQPGGFEAAWLGTVTDTLALGLVPLVLVLFPDGRPPSPGWRPVVWATVVVAVVGTLSTAVAPGEMFGGTPNLIISLDGPPAELARWLASELGPPVLLLTAVSALSLLARLRQARGRQRQQVKWLAYAGVLLTAILVAELIWHPTGLSRTLHIWHPMGLARTIPVAIALWAVYIAIGIAVLRHRLYDIDRLINRTLVYGLLTAMLGLGYAGIVLGQLSGGVTSDRRAARWPAPPWPWPLCSNRPGAASSGRSIGASTGATTTPPRPSRPSAPRCATRLTWPPCQPSCWRWSTR